MSRRMMILMALIAVVMICGGLVFIGQTFVETGARYDPKQSAQEAVTECLDGSRTQCGYAPDSDCWRDVKQAILDPNSQYTIDVLWYNWEDHIPTRGGDEVVIQVKVPNGRAFDILWYEGTIEDCQVASAR